MKKLRTLLTVLVGILIITSCSNNDDGQTAESQNIFTFGNETYEINFASLQTFNNSIQLTFSNADFSAGTYTGDLDFVGILFESQNLVSGTYTFSLDTDPNYDSANNFFDAEAGVSLSVLNGDVDTSTNYYENMNSGTIDIQNSGEIYTIDFNLIFDSGTFNGKYVGTIE